MEWKQTTSLSVQALALATETRTRKQISHVNDVVSFRSEKVK